MSAPAVLRRGWCPGALRPMATGDGLLVRLRFTGGIVQAGLARAVADCAQKFGNGFLDLTSRANLQIRGVSETRLPALFDRLAELGLLDDDPDGEAVRNVISSPLAGLDPTAKLDIRPIVAALEARLAGDPSLHALPQKFGFLVDDGGAIGLADVSMDVRFVGRLAQDRAWLDVAVGGSAADARPIGRCAPEQVVELGAALALAFLRERGSGAGAPRRMRDFLQQDPPDLGRLLAQLDPALLDRARTDPGRGGQRKTAQVLGLRRAGTFPYLGAAAPFGRLSTDGLDRLAATAERFGTGELRLTPWRAVLLPGVTSPAASAELGPAFILDEDDPRRRAAACPGANGCRNGSTPTQADAAALAPFAVALARTGMALHVSGCQKGCALPRPAPVTLVSRNGRYDLIRDGEAGDQPSRYGLTLNQAANALGEMAKRPVPA